MAESEPQLVHSSSRRGRFRFRLGGLMLLVFVVAVGLAVGRREWAKWTDGLTAAAVCWLVLGLANQVLDIWAAYHGRHDLSLNERWGWRFAAAWRCGIASLLISHFVVRDLIASGTLDLPEVKELLFVSGESVRRCLFCLAIIATMASIPRLARPAPLTSAWRRTVDVTGWLSAAFLCSLVWTQQTQLPFFVHLVTFGMEAVEPINLPLLPDTDPNLAVRDAAFVLWTAAAAVVALGDFILVWLLARNPNGGRRLRWSLIALLVAGIATSFWYATWLHATGLYQLCPWLAECRQSLPSNVWLTAALLVFIMTTAWTCRLIHPRDATDLTTRIPWRQRKWRYYHERHFAMLPFLVLFTANVIQQVRGVVQFTGAVWWSALADHLAFPDFYLEFAVFVLATLGICKGWSRQTEVLPRDDVTLPISSFCVVWPFAYLTVAVGSFVIAWFSFALWLTPWYRFEWPFAWP